MGNTPKEKLGTAVDALWDNHGNPYELAIVWKPGQDEPVKVYYIKANGQYLETDGFYTDSPARYPLPASSNGMYDIAWSVVPTTSIDGILIGIVNHQSGARVKVDAKDNPDPNTIWSGEKKIAAP